MTTTSGLRTHSATLFAAFIVLTFSSFLLAQEDIFVPDASVEVSDDENISSDVSEGVEYQPNTLPVGTTITLPRNLSPWGMFMGADWVVKTVMIGLILASILTWSVWLAKSIELWSVKRLAKRNLAALKSVHTLDDAARHESVSGIGKELITIAEGELQLSSDISDKAGIKERVSVSLSRLESAYARRMVIGTGLLATVGAVAPFVGLFGTVWGIMNSFIGISKAQTTNLAVVAPGIAEALLATALGLFAAIPAVIIYNYFVRKVAGTKALISDITAEIMNFVSRDLDKKLNSNLK